MYQKHVEKELLKIIKKHNYKCSLEDLRKEFDVNDLIKYNPSDELLTELINRLEYYYYNFMVVKIKEHNNRLNKKMQQKRNLVDNTTKYIEI